MDFEKAFDSVSWSFLYSTLKFLGFGPSILSWVQTFNQNIKAAVLQSGFLSEFINIEEGCRQGDPIAPYLFIISAQILFLLIENNKCIGGIKIGRGNYKITQFADDTTLILDGTSVSLLAALNTLEIYGSYSGLKINTDKTKLIWIGKKKFSTDKLVDGKKLTWGDTEFDLLGLTFSVDLGSMVYTNYARMKNKIKSDLRNWGKRYITPLGKITVLKTLILPKLNHVFVSLPNPDSSTKQEIISICYKFIWEGKPDKINRNQLCMDYLDGGLRMININCFIKALKMS